MARRRRRIRRFVEEYVDPIREVFESRATHADYERSEGRTWDARRRSRRRDLSYEIQHRRDIEARKVAEAETESQLAALSEEYGLDVIGWEYALDGRLIPHVDVEALEVEQTYREASEAGAGLRMEDLAPLPEGYAERDQEPEGEPEEGEEEPGGGRSPRDRYSPCM